MTPTEKLPADAESFAEHKALRTAEPDPATEPKQPSPAAEPTPAAEPEPEATPEGADDEQPKTPPQEKEKKDRSAAARAKELIAQGRIDEGLKIIRDAERKRAEQAEEELRTLRTRKPEPAAPPATPAAENKPAETDPKPKLKEFLAKDGVSYEDAQEQWLEAVDSWRDRQRQTEVRQAEQAKQNAALQESAARKVADARAKYDDFDEVTAGDAKTGSGLILSPAMSQFVLDHDLGMDVAYELGRNPDEVRRIAALPPTVQIAELGLIAHRIQHPAPENPKPPVSKAPAPPRTVGGAAAPPPKSTAEARSFTEHRRLRTSQ